VEALQEFKINLALKELKKWFRRNVFVVMNDLAGLILEQLSVLFDLILEYEIAL